MSASSASSEPLRTVVAGGGVAGLETLAALHALAGDRVAPVLVAPEADFALRALEVFEPFGFGAGRRYPLADLASELGAAHRRETIARVDPHRRAVVLGSGAVERYDALVLAVGAIAYPAFDHGVLFDRSRRPQDFDALVGDVRSGRAGSVAVVVPGGSAWSLPGYELALLLAAFGRRGAGPRPRVTLVTPEREPLAAFGPPAGAMIREELAAAGVEVVCGVAARVPSDRIVEAGPGRRVRADRVVHLPLLAGPRIAGVPCDAGGFIAADADHAVDGDPDVFAIGDGAAGAFKQGGLAAQQADAVAERIARRAGADRRPAPYAPVLRAVLRTEHGPRYLRAEPPGGDGECLVSDQCLWWPPTKVACRWLTPLLAARDLQAAAAPPARVLPSGGIARGSLSVPTPTRA